MMGYMAFSITDNSDKEIVSIQLFIRDLLELTSLSDSEKHKPPTLEYNDSLDLQDNVNYIKVNDGIPLFSQ